MVWRNDVYAALEQLGGIGSLEQIYAVVAEFKSSPLPASWQAIVRRELEYNSSDSESFKRKHDLFYSVDGIGAGVWGLREAVAPMSDRVDLFELPDKIQTQVYRILRDTAVARRIKKLHGNSCQICGHTLRIKEGLFYSEAHHIQPLGYPHNGPDIDANIIIVCPNHHILLDYGAIELDRSGLRGIADREIGEEFIRYHNASIFRSKSPAAFKFE